MHVNVCMCCDSVHIHSHAGFSFPVQPLQLSMLYSQVCAFLGKSLLAGSVPVEGCMYEIKLDSYVRRYVLVRRDVCHT